MFNDRDLGILGAGALLAVLCLFLPFSFVGKVVLGFLVLVIFMAIALLRLGPDRVPPEVWLMRRLRYVRQSRKYVNQQAPTRTAQNTQKQKPEYSASSAPAQTVIQPVDLAWDEVGVYPLLTILLGVVGVYFVVWLAQGGAAEISIWFK